MYIEGFVSGVMNRGKASPGDRTLVDSLYPASKALKKSVATGKDIPEALEDAFNAAVGSVEKTKNMKPKFRSAVYYGDQVFGKEDQGAVVGKLIFEGFKTALS